MVHMIKKKNDKLIDKSSNLEVLDNLEYGIDEFGEFESLAKSPNLIISFSCYYDHLQGHQVVTNDAAKEFSKMLQSE